MDPVVFLCERHDDFGNNGWRMENRRDFDPMDGFTVAHDVFEHLPDDDQTYSGELQACGAIIWGRGQAGYIVPDGNINPAEVHIGSGIEDVIKNLYDNQDSVGLVKPTKRLRYDFAEELIQDSIRAALKSLEAEARYSDYYADYVKMLLEQRSRVADHLRLGYRKAARRYARHMDSSDFYHCLFHPVALAANRALRIAEPNYHALVVHASLRRKEAWVELGSINEFGNGEIVERQRINPYGS